MPSNKSIILDTHVLIWIVNEKQTKFTTKMVKLISQAAEERALYVSVISLWEIAMLEAKGSIILKEPVLTWIKQVLQHLKVNVIDITPEIAVESANLLSSFHGDPADRIIVASARIMNIPIVTKDIKILAYSKQDRVSALAI